MIIEFDVRNPEMKKAVMTHAGRPLTAKLVGIIVTTDGMRMQVDFDDDVTDERLVEAFNQPKLQEKCCLDNDDKDFHACQMDSGVEITCKRHNRDRLVC